MVYLYLFLAIYPLYHIESISIYFEIQLDRSTFNQRIRDNSMAEHGHEGGFDFTLRRCQHDTAIYPML